VAQITLRHVRKAFGDFVAVRDSVLTIEDGQFFVLLGPSGCGKTTTLRMIAGLELPTSGEMLLDGEDVTFRRARERDIAFVFQLFALYPHMNVRRNIGFPLSAQGVPRAEVRRRVEETARLLQIDHLLDRPVGGLAGGDRQRVALGRAIVRRPKAFLMDEPLGTLDAAFREVMCAELRGLHERIGATTVYVTHDQIEAMAMADVIAVMDKGEVLQAAPPQEIYYRPRTRFVANFIGSPAMNFLECGGGLAAGADRVRLCGTEVRVPRLHEPATHAHLVFGVRPEHVLLDDGAAVRGSVYGVEYMGARQILTVDTAAGRLRVRTPHTDRVSPGETVGLGFDPERVVLFDPVTDRALASDLMPEAGHG
jgi:multiple sugar transport system ATP-binding protein